MKVNNCVLILILIGLIRFSIYACGPFFPEQLLVDRSSTLKYLPDGTFAFEASHLLPPPKDTFIPDQAYYWNYDPIKSREKIEELWFGKNGVELIQKMRLERKSENAYNAGTGLPEEIRSYTAGVIAYYSNDFEEAIKRFDIVRKLPKEHRQKAGLWAQYMTGRCYDAIGDTVNAIKAFRSVRAIALQGAIDSLKLAVASFGEEARIYLKSDNYPKAISLYAEQAAQGSESGVSSLIFVARKIISDDSLLTKTLPDTLCQKLLFAYLYCYNNVFNESEEWSDSVSSKKFLHIIDIVEHSNLKLVTGIDRLAAAAYRAGRYDLAERMCKKSNTGLSWWVRAKLDLHKGNVTSAAKNYHEAIIYFQTNNATIYKGIGYGYESAINRVQAELSALNLSKNEFKTAMELLYKSSPEHWIDAAYVAEKILTVDDLKRFVDENVKLSNNDSLKVDSYEFSENSSAVLRYLLARRLLREKHFKDALKYFDDTRIKEKAKRYIEYYQKAKASKGVKSASYWYKTAVLARYDGMELLGYELDPDYRTFWGVYSLGCTDYSIAHSDYITSEEYNRLRKYQVGPNKRFHYRYLAVDYIHNAASQVPPRSQAYVAMLSKAYWWICNHDFDLSQDLYRQYVHNGAYVPWAFGHSVPDPDFDAAQKMAKAERIRKIKLTIKRIIGHIVKL